MMMSACTLFPFPYVFRIQIRYGQHWAPVHPDEPIQGVLTEMLLAPGEYFTGINARSYKIIDAAELTSNIHTFPRAGSNNPLERQVPLKGLLYFTGASFNYQGIRTSQLVAHRDTCEAP